MLSMTLVGTIVGDPKLKQTPQGRDVLNLTLRCKEMYKNVHHEIKNIGVWDATARAIDEHKKDGDMIAVVARFEPNEPYANNEQEIIRDYRITAVNVEFLPRSLRLVTNQDELHKAVEDGLFKNPPPIPLNDQAPEDAPDVPIDHVLKTG